MMLKVKRFSKSFLLSPSYFLGKEYNMVSQPRRGRRLRLAPKNRQYRGKKTQALSKPMRRAIKQVINRQQERKYRAESYQRILNAVSNSSSNEMFPCVPRTEMPGAGILASSSTRIGQKLTCARAYTDFHVSLAPNIQGSKDIVVKLWILTSKELKNMDDVLSWGAVGNPRQLPINFLSDGNGGTTVPLGTLYDLDLPVESEAFTAQKVMTFRLQKSSQTMNNNTNAYNNVNPATYVASNGATFKRFRVYHKAPKTWEYAGNVTSDYPNNFAPFWTLSYAYSDGTAPVPGNNDIAVNVTNHLEFYDA